MFWSLGFKNVIAIILYTTQLLLLLPVVFIATGKEPDEAVAWYEKPLHGAWHQGVSEVKGMAGTYQLFNKSNIRANTKARIMAAQEQSPNTRVPTPEPQHQSPNTRAVEYEICHTVQDLRHK